MARQPLTAIDADTDAIADGFARLAEGIRSRDVGVVAVDSNHRAHVEQPTEVTVEVTFHPTGEYADLTDIVEYDVDGGDA